MFSQPFLSLKGWPAVLRILPPRLSPRRIIWYQLNEQTLAQLCVSLEPTDSTVFRKLTLFDHNDASAQIGCESQPQLDLLVLESPETLRTADYHRIPRHSGLQAGAAASGGHGIKYRKPVSVKILTGWVKPLPLAQSPASCCCRNRILIHY